MLDTMASVVGKLETHHHLMLPCGPACGLCGVTGGGGGGGDDPAGDC